MTSAGTTSRLSSAAAKSAGQAEPDAALFDRARAGDRGAFGQIVIRHQDRLYNAVLRIVGDFDEARSLTQETFTRALVKIDGFEGRSAPYTWLFRIAANLAISHLRKVQRHRTFTLRAESSGSDDQAASLANRVADPKAIDPAVAVSRLEEAAKVLAAMGKLDAEYRAVLVMRDIEDFDYQQIAEILGLPIGTVKSRLFRARLAMRDELRDVVS